MKPVAILKKSEILKLIDNLSIQTHEDWWEKIAKKYNFDPLGRYACDFTNGGIYEIPSGMYCADVLNKARKERKKEVRNGTRNKSS